MNTRLPHILICLLLLALGFTSNAQVNDHNHTDDHKVEAEQLWLSVLSKEKIKETISRTQWFSKSELDKLFLLFDQRYVQDRFYFYTLADKKDDAALQQHCDSLSKVYKLVFEDYYTNKAEYLKEADKVAAIHNSLSPLTINGPCSNVDFEDGTTNGWSGWVGSACTNPTPCGLSPGLDPDKHQIQTGGYDAIVGGTGLPVVAPGGTYSLRLEDQYPGAFASRVSQTFLVTAANSNFTIRYAVVLEDPVSGHADSERPYFNVSMTDQAGASISCAEYRVIAKPPIVGFTRVGFTNFYYRNWTTVSIPLSAYIGQNVTITFDVSDCSQGAHTGYAYIDGSCLPFQIQTQYSALCSNDPVTLYGPDGYAGYQWTGPGIIGASNIQNIVVNQAGIYNLTMASLTGTGCSSTLAFELTATATTFAGNDTTVCQGNSVQLTATGVGPDVVWSPATGLDNPNVANPIATPAITTTYTVTSCGVSDQITVTVSSGFGVTVSPDVTLCNATSTVLTVTESLPGTYSYVWSPAATLSTANSNVTVASPVDPTTYTVQVLGPDGCVRTGSVTVTINNPITQLNAFVWPTPVCNGESSTLTAVQGVINDNCDVLNTSIWNISGGGGGNACGSVTGNAYFFNGGSVRALTTNTWLDLTGGGLITFSLKVSTGTAPCEDADAGENIVLEYTTNGSVWTIIGTYDEADYPFYIPVSANIPAAASIDGVKFRFRQLTFTAAGQDTWGLDNIQIVRNLILPGSTAGITYSWTPATGVVSPSSLTTQFTPTATSVYTLQISNATTGCDYSSSVTVNVANNFTLSLPTPIDLCSGATVMLNPGASPVDNYEYFWQNATNISNRYAATPVANPTTTTTYTVMVKSPGGCIKTASTLINVVNAPKIKVTSSLNPICGAQAAQLSVNEILISDTIQSTLNMNDWVLSGGVISSSCGSVSGNAITFNGSGIRTLTTLNTLNTLNGGVIEFYLKIANGTGSCDDAEVGDDVVLEYYNGTWNVLATFNEAAYPNFTLARVNITGGATASSMSFRWRQLNNSGVNTDVWMLDNIRILRNLPPTYTYSYAWTPAASLNSAVSATPSATPATDTWYVVSMLSDGICPQKDSVLVRVVPDFALSVNTPTINTCVNSTTTLIAQTDLTAGNYYSIWSPSTGLDNPLSLTPELTVQGNSTYQITITSLSGCQKTASVSVTPSGIGPILNFTTSKLIACQGEKVNLDASIVTVFCGTGNTCSGSNVTLIDLGTLTASNTQYPFTGYYEDGRTQILYTKAELQAYGLRAGDLIKNIGLNVLYKNSSIPYSGFTIKIGCTNLQNFTGPFIAGNTLVYSPKPVTTTVGWNSFALDNPYMWDGNSNLIIEICYDNANYTGYDYVASTTATSNYSCLFNYGDGSAGCTFSSGVPTSIRPLVRLGACTGASNTSNFTWSPTIGLSDPTSLHPVATVTQTVTYTIQVVSTNGCTSTRSRTITVDNSSLADVWADTTCMNGMPVPVHANFSGTAVNTAYNSCNTLPALPSTTPYTSRVGNNQYGSDAWPFNATFTDQRTQFIITASELNAAGITKGAISAITFNIRAKRSIIPFNGFTIKMGCTSATSLTTTTGFIPNTYVVYNPKTYSSVNGLNTLTFDKPYAWDGSSNVIIEICWDNTSVSSSDLMDLDNTAYNSVLMGYSYTASSSGCDLAPMQSSTSRPLMYFNVYPPDPVALTYSWTASAGTVADAVNANTTITATANTWAVFTLSGGVCTVKDSVYIRPNQLPIVHIDSTLDCATGIFTFASDADNFDSYQWSPAVAGNPTGFSVTPVSDLYYVLSVTNDLRCTNKDSVEVRHEGTLVMPEDTILCEGLDINFTAQGGDNYVWQLPGQTITGVDHISFLDVEDAVQLSLLITRHNGCQVTDTWSLGVMDSLDISLTSDLPHVCIGSTTQLTASGSDNYTWSPSSLFSNNDEVQNVGITTDTEIQVKSSNRCFADSAKIMLAVHDLPVIAHADDTTICYATPAQLHATYNSAYQYSWTPAATLTDAGIFNPVATPAGTTSYMVNVSNGFCSSYDTVLVTVLDQLYAEIDASAVEGDIPFTSTLSSHTPASSYSWYTATSSTSFATTQQTSYEITTPSDAVVYLEITNAAGCKAIDSVYLLASYIFIPNLITPNGDGENDTYILVLFGHEWSIDIVNRWGERVYKNENYHNEWGADNVSDGMYYYEIIEKRSNRIYKGWVHVMSRKE